MMLCEDSAPISKNVDVVADRNFNRAAPVNGDGEIHMLILALDYKRTGNPLTCSMDGRNMEQLARCCGVTDVVALYDEQCTKENALDAIREVAGRCDDDDYFVFYYSGHGTSIDDQDGDEEDGKDEAFCFVDAQGQISYDSCLRDDDFAEAVCECTGESVRIIILTDCCHSGSIADLGKDDWGDRHAISIAGCLDGQTSGDMGKGGIFTHSLLLAIDQLEDAGQDDYSVGMLYNATLDKDNKVFNSAQDITIMCSAAVRPDGMAWPLIPEGVDYKAPLTQAAQQAGTGNETAEDVNVASLPPQLLAQLGVSPALTQFINTPGLMDQDGIDPEKLMQAGLQFYRSGGCDPLIRFAQKQGCSVM